MDVSENSITKSTIYVMDADGKNMRVLVQADVPAWDPAWSSDCKQIAYSRDGDIYIINANGTDDKLIIRGGSFFSYEKPAWSPDGEQIAFFVPTGLFIANKDGTHIKQVASDIDWSSSADWSPMVNGLLMAVTRKNHRFALSGQMEVIKRF
jgi:dipeptidyl aminopeptidase/acylaminoacyl peptidase